MPQRVVDRAIAAWPFRFTHGDQVEVLTLLDRHADLHVEHLTLRHTQAHLRALDVGQQVLAQIAHGLIQRHAEGQV